MQSMTGYGRHAVQKDGLEIEIELKTVNHRYLDISFRMSKKLSFLEDELRKRISAALSRGHVDVYLSYSDKRQDVREVQLDMPLLKAYLKAFKQIKAETGIRNDIKMSDIVRLGDVFTVAEAEQNQDEILSLAMECLDGALVALMQMRRVEGGKLRKDLAARLEVMSGFVDLIEARAGKTAEMVRDKLMERIGELLGADHDPARFNAEVVYYVDRASIDEEIVRLRSHIAHFMDLCEEEPVGRKLDFLVQEMNRETNTIGSKAMDIEITNAVLSLKSEIERIREQVQNIE